MTTRLDHLLIRVDNLPETVNEFRDMGFKVYYGNSKKRCHHAMIYFSDQTFIEFIDQSRFPNLLKFLARNNVLNVGPFFKRIGIYATSANRYLDYSFYTPAIDEFYQQTKAHAKVSKLMKLKRIDFFNNKLAWKLFSYDDLELPFMMSDYVPEKYPEAGCTDHLNGVMGISELRLATGSLTNYTSKLSNLFHLPVHNSTVQVGDTQIQLEQGHQFEIRSITLSKTNPNSDFDLSALSKYSIGTSH